MTEAYDIDASLQEVRTLYEENIAPLYDDMAYVDALRKVITAIGVVETRKQLAKLRETKKGEDT